MGDGLDGAFIQTQASQRLSSHRNFAQTQPIRILWEQAITVMPLDRSQSLRIRFIVLI